ncbi:MAG: hypothetical protein IAG10_25915 [Planctomycetaceae bacterium]|nr:hypothetical protein [Planctomycetaceae bacterium]
MQNRSLRACLAVLMCFAPARVFAAGRTLIAARKGQPVFVTPAWPEGVGAIVNDPARTDGWNDGFSEWPNDLEHFAFEIKTTDDLNRLIELLAATKSELRQIRLSHGKEPSGLGWVTNLPKGNNIAVMFSVGNQAGIDEWYKQVRKPFGKMEFTAAPVAVPPTLTIFVQNNVVKLDDLKIPKGITVTSGNLPRVFHRFNTKDERRREEESALKPALKEAKEKLDPGSQAFADQIAAFLKKREPACE